MCLDFTFYLFCSSLTAYYCIQYVSLMAFSRETEQILGWNKITSGRLTFQTYLSVDNFVVEIYNPTLSHPPVLLILRLLVKNCGTENPHEHGDEAAQADVR